MKKLNRRSFLTGIGGTAVALPMLECMTPSRARAGTGPCRYVVMYGGITSGEESEPQGWGEGYVPGAALAPLAARGLTEDVNVVSRLSVPFGDRSSLPAAGAPTDSDHGNCHSPVLAGLSPDDVPGWIRLSACAGPTSDYLVANTIAEGTAIRSMELKVQASNYGGPSSFPGVMSFSGPREPQEPITNLRVAFDTLFGTGSTGPTSEERDYELERGLSVLDLVRARTERLLPTLGRSDARRIDEHFAHIRSAETRIRDLAEATMAECAVPTRSDEPPVNQMRGGWGNETLRGRVFADLLTLAFACDLTRVATVMITQVQSTLGALEAVGVAETFHELSHGGGPGTQADRLNGIAWHVDHFAYLTERLKETPDGDSGSLLDNSVVTYVSEHGWGYDPRTGFDGRAHSPENFVMLQSGRAGGLRPGRHIRAEGRHPAEVLVAGMEAVGATGGLGDITTALESLR